MKNYFILLTTIVMVMACQPRPEKTLYKGKAYSVYPNRVEQGGYTALALSPTHMTSDYQSPANENFPNFIEFKFAINGKDNELPMGINHTFLLEPGSNGKIELPVLTFGEKHAAEQQVLATGSVEANTPLVVKLDARKIIQSMNEKGFFELYTGDKIFKDDFKGIFMAGNLSPLSWDFDNLPSREQFQLKDDDGDGIFELTLALNPYNPEDFTSQDWKLKNDISQYPAFSSQIPLVDALYNMALDETVMNKEEDGTFRTGEAWPGVWTRDVSYSILLAYAYLDTETAKTSLLRKVKNNRIIQDTGTGGAWPVSSDRTTWTLAAWEIYLYTGDEAWLNTIYPIVKNSVLDDMKTIVDGDNNLLMGESSFLDWRKQTYPVWMDGVDIYKSRCLGTNAVHYRTLEILGEMARLKGEDNAFFVEMAQKVKTDINDLLWLDNKGYYAQYMYGRNHQSVSPRSEALGEAFTVLFDIADTHKASRVTKNTPVVDYGVPCIYPQIPNLPPYHNNGIWPFVQAYWNWACAKTENMAALEQGLASINRAAALFLTNKENMVADNGDFRDTEINSNRQLWSVAGNLAMVYRVFMGMTFETDGLYFSPVVPKVYAGHLAVDNFKYRDARLSIEVKGFGSEIKAFKVNGNPMKEYMIPAHAKGNQRVEIILANKKPGKGKVNVVDNRFSLPNPLVTIADNKLSWPAVEGAESYNVIMNGEKVASVTDTHYTIEITKSLAEYQVQAVNNEGVSFLSEPIAIISSMGEINVPAEKYARKSFLPFKGYNGTGFVELTRKKNTKINLKASVKEAGWYAIDVRYANGSGPGNTDNKCAIRTLLINGAEGGVLVMPQRGKDEWSNWGWSNAVKTDLKKGVNKLTIQFLPHNENMNGEVNRAMLDEVRLRRIK
ncbi:glycogen debranching protein [Marinilabiliaceae bacterium JC017]|nr:glycogen debranching protein [Marinilabiliaceae bacterium JC017]